MSPTRYLCSLLEPQCIGLFDLDIGLYQSILPKHSELTQARKHPELVRAQTSIFSIRLTVADSGFPHQEVLKRLGGKPITSFATTLCSSICSAATSSERLYVCLIWPVVCQLLTQSPSTKRNLQSEIQIHLGGKDPRREPTRRSSPAEESDSSDCS